MYQADKKMEYIILLIIFIIIYLILRYLFDVDIKRLKQIGENKELDDLTQRYPENIEICEWYLKKLNNENVKIEEDKNSNSTLYLVTSNKIFIANLKNSYTRIQTIAHECLHSIQSKKLLWFNFIFSNLYLLYFAITCILAIFKLLPNQMLFLTIQILLGFVFYIVRTYLENDAMIKGRFLAKEYMQETQISSKDEIDKIVAEYDKIDDIGIKITNFQLFNKTLIKDVILDLIFIILSII